MTMLDNANDLSEMVMDHHATFDACGPVTVWGRGFGGVGALDSQRGNGANVNTRWVGFIAGVDYRFETGVSLGVADSYAATSLATSDGWGKSQFDSTTFAVTGSGPVAGGRVDVDVFYTANAASSYRPLPDNNAAIGHPDGYVLGGGAQFTLPLMGGDVTPLAAINVAQMERSGTMETGPARFALQIDRGVYSSVLAKLGARFSHKVDVSDVALLPELDIGVQEELTALERNTTIALASGGTSYFAPHASPVATAFTSSVALKAQVDDVVLSVRGDGVVTNRYRRATVGLDASIRF